MITVNDLIEILQRASDLGAGDYIVTCNDEYKIIDDVTVSSAKRTVDLGGN